MTVGDPIRDTVFQKHTLLLTIHTFNIIGPARAPFWVLRPQNLTAVEGNEAHFSCGCSGNPQPTVFWQRVSTLMF